MFQELQNAILAKLKTVSLLEPVWPNIIARGESDVDALVAEAMETGIGLAVVVLYPFPEELFNGQPGLACKKLGVQIQVVENVQSNTSGITCLKCAEFIHRALSVWAPACDGIQSVLVARASAPWRDPATESGRNEIVLFFETSGAVDPLT